MLAASESLPCSLFTRSPRNLLRNIFGWMETAIVVWRSLSYAPGLYVLYVGQKRFLFCSKRYFVHCIYREHKIYGVQFLHKGQHSLYIAIALSRFYSSFGNFIVSFSFVCVYMSGLAFLAIATPWANKKRIKWQQQEPFCHVVDFLVDSFLFYRQRKVVKVKQWPGNTDKEEERKHLKLHWAQNELKMMRSILFVAKSRSSIQPAISEASEILLHSIGSLFYSFSIHRFLDDLFIVLNSLVYIQFFNFRTKLLFLAA